MYDKINLDQLEKDIMSGKIGVNELKKEQAEILKQNKAFYKWSTN